MVREIYEYCILLQSTYPFEKNGGVGMVSINQRLNQLVINLSRTDEQNINSVVDKVANVMRADTRLKIAETWVGGSVGKGTNIRGQSDIDLVFLLSHRQSIANEEALFELVRGILTDISEITPETPYKATKIKVSGIEVDVLVTKLGLEGRIGEAQYSKRHVKEILDEGTLFTNTARILKYWKILPDNIPEDEYISSFDIEVILGYVFKNKEPENFYEAVKTFFDYVAGSRLQNQLSFPPGGTPLVHRSFNFGGKTFFIDQARKAQKYLRNNPPDLSFLDI